MLRGRSRSLEEVTSSSASFGSALPLVQLSFALNYAVHGLDVAGYHALNLFLHAATGLVLFGVVRRTLGSPTLAPRFGDRADAQLQVLGRSYRGPATTPAVLA